MTAGIPDHRATEIFLAALDTPQNERKAFVADECAGDETLQRHVERLLALEERSSGLLESSAWAEEAAGPLVEGLASLEVSFLDEAVRDAFSTVRDVTTDPVGGEKIAAGSSEPAVGKAKRDATAPSERFAGFEIRERIGRGGFGAVYRARDSRLSREVALKVLLPQARLDPSAQQRFLEEAKVLAQIRHPNVIVIHSVLEDDDRIGLVMEFIDGETLEEFVERTDRLGAEEACQIGLQLCTALAAVHGRDLVHRDVKPANILRERGGRIVLCDFGLGVFVEHQRTDERAGSPLFMAPEQVRGVRVDCRADIYAVGNLLYWCVTRDFPYPADSAMQELFAAKLDGKPAPLRDKRPDLPARFVEVVHKALNSDPDARFQTAGELEQALISCLGSHASSSIHGPRRPTDGPRRWFRWTAWILATAAVAAVAIALSLPLLAPGGPLHEASLWRTRAWEDEPIRSGDTIRPGDELFLRFEAGKARFVYVINDDGESSPTLLFPQEDGDVQNPLQGELAHVLPGTRGGKLVYFGLQDARKRETLFVLASTTRIDQLELLALQPLEISPEVALATRGMGPKETPFDPRTDGRRFLATLVARLHSGELGERSEGLWIETIRLTTE